ncbi:MAG: type II secretion system F family protein [Parcubacteria group bacterium]|jgi:type IV pilus assembly protein PilC
MPKYSYTAKNFEGAIKNGKAETKDEKALAQSLRSEGFLVTSIKLIEKEEKGSRISFFDRFGGVPLKEKMVFARNLSVMVSSGLPISKAVKNLSIQTKSKKFKKILLDIHEELERGETLSESLRKYPLVFSDLFVNMVKVGEAGGTLEESLNIVATQLEKDHDLIGKIRGAMMYPAVILIAMFGIGIIMMTFILPKLTSVFKDMDVELPSTTKALIATSDFMRNHSIIVVILFISFAVFLKLFWSSKLGKKFFGFLSIKMPVIKNLVIKINCARFARIYSSLLKSGVSVVEALKISSDTLENYFYKEAINDGIEKIQKGVSLSAIISSYPKIFPSLVPQMIEVGEETGKIESVLLKLAEFYEEEVNQITKNMSSIIEPVLMLLIGSAVGVFAVSMLQPMYSMMDSIK